MLNNLNKKISSLENGSVRDFLTKVKDIFALQLIRNNISFLRNCNYFDSSKAIAIKFLVLQLTKEVEPLLLQVINNCVEIDQNLYEACVLTAPIGQKGNFVTNTFEQTNKHAMKQMQKKIKPLVPSKL